MSRSSSDLPPGWSARAYKSAERKVRKLDESTLLAFADMSGTGMAMAFSDFRKNGETVSLDEIQEGLVALWAVAAELRVRALTST